MSIFAGVDVGGTFTDVVVLNTVSGQVTVTKVATSINQSESFIAGLTLLSSIDKLEAVVHGTTVGTNALLENKGACTGLITTEGFRDLLQLGRRTRPTTYGMTGSFEPLIPRDRRLEVKERVQASGEVIAKPDKEGIQKAGLKLLQSGVESLAIVFLHSYVNPSAEIFARKALKKIWPNVYISLSHEVLPEVGEFERTSTTVLNAYLQPLLHRYLIKVESALSKAGYRRPFLVMQSNGGALNVENSYKFACRSILSGPAGGVIAAGWLGRQLGLKNIISADMGGTSFDVGFVVDGEPALAEQKEFIYGVPSRIPMIDIDTIGAGGGSIARVDEAGLLHVGPESAGSNPGPVCYGQGGQLPTVTDANFLLGRLNIRQVRPGAENKAEDVTAAFKKLGKSLGLSAEQAAVACLRIVDMNMANAIKRNSLSKGHDPRECILLPFGGAGPIHACSIADELDVPKIIIPPWPGVFSALGCLLAEIRHDDTWSVHCRINLVTKTEIIKHYRRMVDRVLIVMKDEGIDKRKVNLTYEAALQYEGQTHRVIVNVPSPEPLPELLLTLFENEYRRRYSVMVSGVPVRLVNLRVRAVAARGTSGDLRIPVPIKGTLKEAITGVTRMMFGKKWYEVCTYDRWKLPANSKIEGPARIDQSDTSTVLPPHWDGSVDQIGNLVLQPKFKGKL